MEAVSFRFVVEDPAEPEFEISLLKKQESFGSVELEHLWLPVTPLYGQRRRDSVPDRNHREILRHYWAVVRREEAVDERPAQERYLLASLVPQVRAEGSRTIFADAFLARGRRKDAAERAQNLSRMLDGDRQVVTREAFCIQTREVLGRTEFPAGAEEIRDRFARDLLDEPRALLASGDVAAARELAAATWGRWMRTIARRGDAELEKIALDALSYEARAAFHDCYSVLWCRLVPGLFPENRQLQASLFHWFWHTSRMDRIQHTHLFHGHVFGLHPAMGPFLLAEAGRRLVGDWLEQPEDGDCFGRLLGGLLIACWDYGDRRESTRVERQGQSKIRGVPDLAPVEEQQEERRRGHRRKGERPR